MRLPRVRFLAAAVVAAITMTSTSRAADRFVDFDCIGTGEDAYYENRPNPITVVAGTDRVIFRTAPYPGALACTYATNSPTIEVWLWGASATFYLWYSDTSTQPQGPFCEAGDYAYPMLLRGSHGEINGALPAGTIRVAPSAGAPVPASVTIGVFAERTASTCVLPATPGPHQAYVCVYSHDAAPVKISTAEFRIGGFPESWFVSAAPEPVIWDSEGDPLGAGVRLQTLQDDNDLPYVLVLYTLQYVVPQPDPAAIIEVQPSSQFGIARPWVAWRDGDQVAHQACAIGGRAVIGAVPVPCAVGTTAKSWSDVRLLYR